MTNSIAIERAKKVRKALFAQFQLNPLPIAGKALKNAANPGQAIVPVSYFSKF